MAVVTGGSCYTASVRAVAAALERGDVDALDLSALAPPWDRVAGVAVSGRGSYRRGTAAFLGWLTDGWLESSGLSREWLAEELGSVREAITGRNTIALMRAASAAAGHVNANTAANRPSAAPGPLVALSTIPEEDIEWLWPGRLAWGHVAVLAGDGATGKSTLAAMIAAGLTRGVAPPGGAPLDRPRDVVLLTNEEDPASVIAPRMRLMGANLDRVHVLTPDRTAAFTLPADGEWLAAFCTDRDAGMVIVDTGPSFTDPELNGHREENIRAFLAPLQTIAQRLRAVPVVIAHLNKASGANSRHRIMGGAAWVNAPRITLMVGAPPGDDPRQTGARMVAVEKSNLGVYPQAFSFELAASPDDPTRAVVAWGSEVDGVSSGDLVGHSGDGSGERSALDDASDLLASELADGPQTVRDLRRAATDAGVSWRTIERAKARLGIDAIRASDGNTGRGEWRWQLPDDATGKSANDPRRTCESDDWRTYEIPDEHRDLTPPRPQVRHSHGNGGLGESGGES